MPGVQHVGLIGLEVLIKAQDNIMDIGKGLKMHRIIENILFLKKHLSIDEPTKRKESITRLEQFARGGRLHLSDDLKQCFKNPTIKLGPDD